MAPELMLGLPYDPNKIETWALGICLYKLLTGKFPFAGKSDEELKRQIRERSIEYPDHLSLEAVELLNKMLTKESLYRATTTEVLIDKWFMDMPYQKPVRRSKPKFRKFGAKKILKDNLVVDKSISKLKINMYN
mmetsp:Transcript_15535/g.13576  ORF Transcript_15535/g.13576 Transcript_15535/m.13576 type:complete len:134 (+) Transcript_15535:1026-1427(+)